MLNISNFLWMMNTSTTSLIFDKALLYYVASACDTSSVSLDLKPLPDSFRYVCLGLSEFLSMIITFDLDKG